MYKYINLIGYYLDRSPEYIYTYWKGRVALYSCLLAAGIEPGDEIIIPSLTCVVVPNAIIYTGAKPIYSDINPETLTTDLSSLKGLINKRTKAIIIQNTFGLSADIEETIALAKSYNIITIDDCTHGFGGIYNGHPNGTLTDASFFRLSGTNHSPQELEAFF